MIWLVPVVVAVVVAGPIALAMRRLARDASALRREVAAFSELRTPAAELRGEAMALRAAVPELALRTRPSGSPAS